MIRTLARAARALRQNIMCGNCGFWYDDRYGHSCTPC